MCHEFAYSSKDFFYRNYNEFRQMLKWYEILNAFMQCILKSTGMYHYFLVLFLRDDPIESIGAKTRF